ncbi:SPFH domain-containing protein [Lentisphaerota bacterium WC36G]|nr:hypothetical protein LJT99_13420 [Lentisphaerae bacterium WC36]
MQNRNIAQDEYGSFALGIKALVKGFKIFFAGLLFAIIGMLGYFVTLNGYFEADPGHAVVLMRFGKYVETYPASSGANWSFPEPVSRKIKIPTNPQTMNIQFNEKILNPTRPSKALAPGRDDYLITGDTNIVLSGWDIVYQIKDPEKFFLTCYSNDFEQNLSAGGSVSSNSIINLESLQNILTNRFRNSVIKVTASSEVSKVLYGVNDYRMEVIRDFNKSVEKLDIGVVINTVNIPRQPSPPEALKEDFRRVASIDTSTQQKIDEATQEADKIIQDAATEANKVVADAKAYKTRIVQSTIAENIRFQKIYKEYTLAPEAVSLTLMNNTLSEILGQIDRKYIISKGKGEQQVRIKINPEVEKVSQEELLKRAIELEANK